MSAWTHASPFMGPRDLRSARATARAPRGDVPVSRKCRPVLLYGGLCYSNSISRIVPADALARCQDKSLADPGEDMTDQLLRLLNRYRGEKGCPCHASFTSSATVLNNAIVESVFMVSVEATNKMFIQVCDEANGTFRKIWYIQTPGAGAGAVILGEGGGQMYLKDFDELLFGILSQDQHGVLRVQTTQGNEHYPACSLALRRMLEAAPFRDSRAELESAPGQG